MPNPLVLTLLAIGVALSAFAPLVAAQQPSCARWGVAMVQREEGRQWTASVCTPRKTRDALLEIVCAGGDLNIRYQPVLRDGTDPADGMRDFDFAMSSGTRRVALGFEGLDGAFATDLDRRHPLFEMLMSGDRLRIRDTRGAVATHSYTLAGSRKALTKLMAQCR